MTAPTITVKHPCCGAGLMKAPDCTGFGKNIGRVGGPGYCDPCFSRSRYDVLVEAIAALPDSDAKDALKGLLERLDAEPARS